MSGVPGATARLEGLRVLVVEDNFLIGLSLKSRLERLGCHVVGPVATRQEADAALNDEAVDAAVLDINLRDGTSLPIARRLQEDRRPFVFVTGYVSPWGMPQVLEAIPRVRKPIDERHLRTALIEVLVRGSSLPPDESPSEK